jgi:mannose-1-phosphate guanylyltransferase
MPKRIAVVMAGGTGERFWPLSRRQRPKQLLRLAGKMTLLEESVNRIETFVGAGNVYVVTGADQAPLVRKTMAGYPPENIIVEPMGRDTAPCLALMLAHLSHSGEDPTMIVLTADHSIGPVDRFHADCRAAFEAAETDDVLVTFGIQPTRPDTGFGYIELGERVADYDGSQVYRVVRFREKPNTETAHAFLQAGNFLWNSGMFVWRASVLTRAFEEHAPQIAQGRAELAQALGQASERDRVRAIFETIPKLSIDYAVMERADNVRCVRATFKWDDVGTWSSLARLHPTDPDGNTVVGRALMVETKNSIVYVDERESSDDAPIVATLGLEDLIVVVTSDAVLVCHRDQAQRIKQITQNVRAYFGERFV